MSAKLNYVSIQDSYTGIRAAASGSVLKLDNATIKTTYYGLYLLAGMANVSNLEVSNSVFGVWLEGATTLTLNRCRLLDYSDTGIRILANGLTNAATLSSCVISDKSGAQYGLDINASANGQSNVNIEQSTIHGNKTGLSSGVSVGAKAIVSVNNSNVAGNDYGVVGQTNPGPPPSVNYSNVWNNIVDYIGSTPGIGCISANPLYVDAPTNFRLTSNSPS